MRGRIDFGINEITDLKKMKTTNYSLAFQNKATIPNTPKHAPI